jgi:hypothetical protein
MEMMIFKLTMSFPTEIMETIFSFVHCFDEIPKNIFTMHLKKKVLIIKEFNDFYKMKGEQFSISPQLHNCKEIILEEHDLYEITQHINKMQNLELIILDFCKLNSIHLNLCQLQNLKKLKLRCNNLSSLPDEIGNLTNLSVLDFYQNYLMELEI